MGNSFGRANDADAPVAAVDVVGEDEFADEQMYEQEEEEKEEEKEEDGGEEDDGDGHHRHHHHRDDLVGEDVRPATLPTLWSSFSSHISNFTPNTLREVALMAMPLRNRLQRDRLLQHEQQLVDFISNTEPMDFSQALPAEVIAHMCSFLDGEDLLCLERTCHTLQDVVSDAILWKELLEKKRGQITFVPFISEKARVVGCRNWEQKHCYFRSCVWTSPKDLQLAVMYAQQSALGGEIHLTEGTYRGLHLEGLSVDMTIMGHGEVIIENTSAWRPPIHICSESSLNPSAFMREQLSYVAGYMPKTLSQFAPMSSYIMPEYLTSLLRTPAESPTIVLENLRVQVGASAEQVATFPIYVEGQTHVVVHRCTIVGQRLSAILVSKGAQCDVIESDIGHSTEDGVFYVLGGGSVRGCKIHSCAMNAIEVRGASRDVIIENNIITGNGCGLHVPWREGQATTGLQDIWNGKIHFRGNQVFDNMGPSMRVEKCGDNPHMGIVSENVVFNNAEQRPLSRKLQEALDKKICTRSATGDQHDYQPWYECVTCKLDMDHMESGVCESCVRICHAGHQTYQRWTHTRSFCDCVHTSRGCLCQGKDEGEEGLSLSVDVEGSLSDGMEYI